MPYQSTKTYGHDLGLSACFRQHRATHSHCSLLHGYALSFRFVFQCTELDDKNWVQDFGGLKQLKQSLYEAFDHKLIIAEDDPEIDELTTLGNMGLADAIVMPAVGCEAFAKFAFDLAVRTICNDQGNVLSGKFYSRVKVVSCECAEHGANSAIYIGV